MVMIKRAKVERIPSAQYTEEFQEKYFSQNYEHIDPDLKQMYLSHSQSNLLNKLRKAIAVPNRPVETHQGSDDSSYKHESLDFIDKKHNQEKRIIANSSKVQKCNSTSTVKKTFGCEESAIKNVQFVESIINLIEESERDTNTPKTVLQSLLYDDTDSTSDLSKDNLENSFNMHFLSDSGIGTCSELLTESTCVTAHSVSNNVVKSVVNLSKTKHLVMNSVRLIINHLKQQIQHDVEYVFHNWKGSVAEFMSNILSKCSQVSTSCRELLLNFICDLLDDVWLDRRKCQHRSWEMKICIVNELTTSTELCEDVIKNIIEKTDYFLKCYVEKDENLSMMMDKLFLYLNLLCTACDNLVELGSKITKKTSERDIFSENDFTHFWQDMGCSKDNKANEGFEIGERLVQTMERMSILTSTRHPLVASVALEAAAKGRHLMNLSLDESQTELSGFSLSIT